MELRQDRKRLKLRNPFRAAVRKKKKKQQNDILQFDVMLIPFPGHLISFAR